VLLFSQSLGMLSLLEKLARYLSLSFLRLDGGTAVTRRAQLIHSFNSDPAVFLMLLTTKTGGVGVSLTAANRVVLVDPDWNPQTDIQARERAWRLGQKREVTIFRLITRGTIEEKIYQRQIFKVLLSSRILDNPRQKQLFTKTDLKELFTLTDDDGVGEDLPQQGEVVLSANNATSSESSEVSSETSGHVEAVRSSTCETLNTSLVSNTSDSVKASDVSVDPEDEEKRRERRLLTALWNGDAISGVYDHAVLDPTDGSDPRRHYADHSVKESIRHLQSSVAPETETERRRDSATSAISSTREVRFGNSRSTGPGEGQSSSAMLAGLRRGHVGAVSASSVASPLISASSRTASLPAPRSVLSSPPSTTNPFSTPVASDERSHRERDDSQSHSQSYRTPEADMIPRLRRLFSTGEKFTSQQLLSRFGRLDDRFASLFRETLRRIARLENGYWVKR